MITRAKMVFQCCDQTRCKSKRKSAQAVTKTTPDGEKMLRSWMICILVCEKLYCFNRLYYRYDIQCKTGFQMCEKLAQKYLIMRHSESTYIEKRLVNWNPWQHDLTLYKTIDTCEGTSYTDSYISHCFSSSSSWSCHSVAIRKVKYSLKKVNFLWLKCFLNMVECFKST